jgi:hypothetical protein
MVYFARIFCTRKGAGFQRLGFRAEFLIYALADPAVGKSQLLSDILGVEAASPA